MQFHLFILLVIFSTNAAAIKLIKCENSDGIIEYSDSPCPSGSKQISETVINSNTNLTVMDAPLPRPKEAKKDNKKDIVEQSDETAKCEEINEKLSNAERQFVSRNWINALLITLYTVSNS
ncbi:MAG: hypothetical protein P8Y20_07935 [Gammaproteobacteria bacterium]